MTVTAGAYRLEVDTSQWTRAQQRALTELMDHGGERPTFEPDLHHELRARLEASLGPLVHDLPTGALALNKHALTTVLSCESYHVTATAEGFPGWNPATARGTIAHQALARSVHRQGNAPPSVLVDETIARIVETGDERSPQGWLQSAPEAELAELRHAATEWVTAFQECFPPLQRGWLPRLEPTYRVDLCSDRVVLRARPDLVLGRSSGGTARELVVDFKTGAVHAGHADDGRFYALVMVLRMGTPPWRAATYSLESATWAPVDIDEAALRAAVDRVVGGARRLVELRGGRPPDRTPGPPCGWCAQRSTCDGAVEWRSRLADDPAWLPAPA